MKPYLILSAIIHGECGGGLVLDDSDQIGLDVGQPYGRVSGCIYTFLKCGRTSCCRNLTPIIRELEIRCETRLLVTNDNILLRFQSVQQYLKHGFTSIIMKPVVR